MSSAHAGGSGSLRGAGRSPAPDPRPQFPGLTLLRVVSAADPGCQPVHQKCVPTLREGHFGAQGPWWAERPAGALCSPLRAPWPQAPPGLAPPVPLGRGEGGAVRLGQVRKNQLRDPLLTHGRPRPERPTPARAGSCGGRAGPWVCRAAVRAPGRVCCPLGSLLTGAGAGWEMGSQTLLWRRLSQSRLLAQAGQS